MTLLALSGEEEVILTMRCTPVCAYAVMRLHRPLRQFSVSETDQTRNLPKVVVFEV